MIIGWGDVYKVVVSMAPSYVALGLGYLSVKRWKMFKPDQCDAINRFSCYFIIPFFNFDFIASIDPYSMNYRFLAADVIAKAITGVAWVLWAKLGRKGNFLWAITSFGLSCFNNTLVVGVPLLEAMYGPLGKDLVIQSSVLQALIWFPVLLFLLEFRRTCREYNLGQQEGGTVMITPQVCVEIVVEAEGGVDDKMTTGRNTNAIGNENGTVKMEEETTTTTTTLASSSYSLSLGSTLKKVGVELARNPNCYACVGGLIWALLAKRWNLEMPKIVEGSITIMAKAGSGAAMFTMGLIMAQQKDIIIGCGVRLTIFILLLRFVIGPFGTTVGALALGLRSDILRIVIVQAALPQSIAAFVLAQEYGLHANVLGTMVIFGTIISLPLLIGYYVALGSVH